MWKKLILIWKMFSLINVTHKSVQFGVKCYIEELASIHLPVCPFRFEDVPRVFGFRDRVANAWNKNLGRSKLFSIFLENSGKMEQVMGVSVLTFIISHYTANGFTLFCYFLKHHFVSHKTVSFLFLLFIFIYLFAATFTLKQNIDRIRHFARYCTLQAETMSEKEF